jgi:hypothetical protein
MLQSDKQRLLWRIENADPETANQRINSIATGLLAMCSERPEDFEPGTRIRAVWCEYPSLRIQTQTLGPLRRIGWDEAERIVETGIVNVVTVVGSEGRPAMRKPAHREFNGKLLERKTA